MEIKLVLYKDKTGCFVYAEIPRNGGLTLFKVWKITEEEYRERLYRYPIKLEVNVDEYDFFKLGKYPWENGI